MESWHERYRKNYTIGIAISFAVHSIALLVIYLLPQSSDKKLPGYFDNTYTTILKVVNVGNIEIVGGGGSSGDGTEGFGKNLVREKSVFGTPVPVPEPVETNFGKSSDLDDKKDTLTLQSGSGLETGKGNGKGNGVGDGIGNGQGYGFGNGLGSEFKQLPFMPKQILEVLPQKIEDVKGIIVLALKIGLDGNVKDHKVIFNTVGNAACLKYVLEAAYKSKWERVKMEGKQIEYWIEKTYGYL